MLVDITIEGGLTQASVQGYLSPRRIHRCVQSAGGTNCPRLSKSGQKTSLADSITNIGWRKWQPTIQIEFLRTTPLDRPLPRPHPHRHRPPPSLAPHDSPLLDIRLAISFITKLRGKVGYAVTPRGP